MADRTRGDGVDTTGYDPKAAVPIADDAVLYVVQAAGNTWVRAPYREQGSVASYEHAKLNPKGIESVNASPPNTGTGATGHDITPEVSGTYPQHQLTSQLL